MFKNNIITTKSAIRIRILRKFNRKKCNLFKETKENKKIKIELLFNL